MEWHLLPARGGVQLGWRADMEIHYTDRTNLGLLRSLSAIHDAKTQYYSIKASASTPTVLLSKIKLCDVLLREIHAIRNSLAGVNGRRNAAR
jgi:hypothetical protein